MNFDTLDYLQSGNNKQQKAYNVLTDNGVMEKLHAFFPILTGTIPINIDIENSDLDIICYWEDKQVFIDTITEQFRHHHQFSIRKIPEHNVVVAGFILNDFEIEVFGQNIPVKQQLAYRHMLIEYKILEQRGEAFRQEIINLKRSGLKTEPAFAMALGIKGDPYEVLLDYEL